MSFASLPDEVWFLILATVCRDDGFNCAKLRSVSTFFRDAIDASIPSTSEMFALLQTNLESGQSYAVQDPEQQKLLALFESGTFPNGTFWFRCFCVPYFETDTFRLWLRAGRLDAGFFRVLSNGLFGGGSSYECWQDVRRVDSVQPEMARVLAQAGAYGTRGVTFDALWFDQSFYCGLEQTLQQYPGLIESWKMPLDCVPIEWEQISLDFAWAIVDAVHGKLWIFALTDTD
eukprot:TRINITY_DN6234_c0_g1_i1.p1 TRINITY_DN6234_c0_g1~~TRINITY_DN6234_c0_g1_i1.p1  ORF type:complete len:231 (-),score=28.99 TRINITY_DN6234_c0_g1_i1:104-796(-)